MKILRYTIPAFSGIHEVEMPFDSHIVRVRQKPNEFSTVSIWAIVNSKSTTVKRSFRCVLTNEDFEKNDLEEMRYLNTVFPSESKYALHVFQILQ